MTVVVDTSVAVKWVFNEVLSREARSLREFWIAEHGDIAVPSWFSCEVANVFFQSIRVGRDTQQDAEMFITAILQAVSIVDVNGNLAVRAPQIADAAGQKATYDSFYVALAEHLKCELWTADERSWQAVSGNYPFVKWLGNVSVS
jgi:predicted nucleic acid-binding protein